MINSGFITILEDSIGADNTKVVLSALMESPSVSIRYNPSKIVKLNHFAPYSTICVDWNKYAYFLDERPVFTLDPFFHSALYYVQDSSAMFVGDVFRQSLQGFLHITRPIRVLDLCAAPGGKTTDIASSLRDVFGDNFILIANEVTKQRASILAENVAKWGDANIVVTSCDPKVFAHLEGFFDIIIADVPCSGEGMFRKDEAALVQWSLDNVKLCQARQRRIVADVWASLKTGGCFIYSTCTFNKYENDNNVEWICNTLGADNQLINCNYNGVIKTKYGVSLVMGKVRGEGQYCAVVTKTSCQKDFNLKQGKQTIKPPSIINDVLQNLNTWNSVVKNNLITAYPAVIAAEIMAVSVLHPILTGVAVGQIKGKDFIPHADLALNIKLNDAFFVIRDVEKEDALTFLSKGNLVLNATPKGLILLKYKGIALGFVKNLGNRCNNLLPVNRRIRMNYE